MRRSMYLRIFLPAVLSFLACLSLYAATNPTFKIAGPATITPVKNPGSAGILITVTPENGFTGGLNLVSCTLLQPPSNTRNLPTCTEPGPLNKEPVATISGANPATFPLNVATAGVATPDIRHKTSGLALGGTLLACGALLFMPIRIRRYKKYEALLILLFSVTLVSAVVGCGGGMSTTTPQGNYTFTVTCADAATGKINASGNFTVSVQ